MGLCNFVHKMCFISKSRCSKFDLWPIALKKEDFKRDTSGYEDMLDDYWTLEIAQIAKRNPHLNKFFESVDFSDVNISIAGKSVGLNDEAYQTALEVLPDLQIYLEESISNVELETENGWWNLTSIWFPYQEEKMWYLHFTSQYGSDLEVCFVRANGKYVGCTDPIAHVLPTIKYVLNELKKTKIHSKVFENIVKRINANETIGREFIVPLISIVEEQTDKIEPYVCEHLLKLLGELRCSAIA
jgi:hypothetical protein